MPSHFYFRILPSEFPLDTTLRRVTAQLPGIYFGDDRGLIRQTPIKALAVKNADFDFSHIEPTGVFRRVVVTGIRSAIGLHRRITILIQNGRQSRHCIASLRKPVWKL